MSHESFDGGLALISQQPAHHLRCKLQRVTSDHISRKPDSFMNQIKSCPVRILSAHIIQLEVMQPNACVRTIALRQRQADKSLSGFGCLIFINFPEALLDGRRGRHILKKHSQCQVVLASYGIELIDAYLDRYK